MIRKRMMGRWIECVASAAVLLAAPRYACAAEHITLRTGFSVDCIRRETQGDKVRLFFAPEGAGQTTENYLDVSASSIVRIDPIPDPPALPAASLLAAPPVTDLHLLLSNAGTEHHIDAELLASVVHAESGGHTRAVSRTGARGLMQLMPATAAQVGVKDAFAADQNIEGGSAYLDQMLTRYHDDIALALAAYNAGPAAVDRYHGVPPFRETRAYVSRVIREFNRRKVLLATNQSLAQIQALANNQPLRQ